jgi:hypothetical protein
MTINESVTFDYLKPDFSILKDKRRTDADMLPEHIFYFKHRIIHWLNQVNEKNDPTINFENIKIDQYVIGKNKQVNAKYKLKDSDGHIIFLYDYDDNNNFIEVDLELEIKQGVFDHLNFPNSSHFFDLQFALDEENELDGYFINRPIDVYKNDALGYLIRYVFYKDAQKKDHLALFDCVNQESLILDIDNGFELSEFDDFFNVHINDILKSSEAFVTMYPYFSVKQVNSNETLEVFYKELKEAYNKGIFDTGLSENLHVVKMAGI